MTPQEFVLSWPYRVLATGMLVTTPVLAQPVSVEQRVATEIGNCVIQRANSAADVDLLKAKVAELEKKLAEKKQEK